MHGIALYNLIKRNNTINPNTLMDEMYYLFDRYSEEQIEKLAQAKL